MSIDSLQLVAAQSLLGLISPEQLARNAVAALASGKDSRSLRMLAGLAASEMDEARALFHRALEELNIPQPNQEEAVGLLVVDTAERILSEQTTRYAGAKQIWALSHFLAQEQRSQLDPFIYAASEWEDRPADRRFFESAIVEAARQILSK